MFGMSINYDGKFMKIWKVGPMLIWNEKTQKWDEHRTDPIENKMKSLNDKWYFLQSISFEQEMAMQKEISDILMRELAIEMKKKYKTPDYSQITREVIDG